ncbi:MAG TPA: PQQ-binding-like beta-propeller repeat protein, partial [Armatimonadota bacterium]|nr:PQQ-binding-like beta-propeller repeat protein [Armatimonadota bacterium]
SGITSEALPSPLKLNWVHEPAHAPAPAWPAPAQTNPFKAEALPPRVTYDRAYHVAAVGDAVYFGSSADDKIHCLDAATGRERWTYFTEAPVRLTPTVHDGRVYAGSDDGWVYCLDAADGTLVWRHSAAPSKRRLPGNGRVISSLPCRTGVIIQGDHALFGAGLFPAQGAVLVRLDAETGDEIAVEPIKVSPQGYIKLSEGRLFIPTGRGAPATSEFVRRATRDAAVPDVPTEYPYSPIVAGETLYAGGDGKVAAFDNAGTRLWDAEVAGQALGLAAANGRLFVSSDTGAIYCFSSTPAGEPVTIAADPRVGPHRDRGYADAAESIISRTGITKGYCLDLGCGEGRLALELAGRSDLKIIAVSPNPRTVGRARDRLDAAGVYGQVSVHSASLDDLPYVDSMFNLIVSDRAVSGGAFPGKASEILRVLRPDGGMVCIGRPGAEADAEVRTRAAAWWSDPSGQTESALERGRGTWLVVRRGALPGSGEWTHQYADAANTSCSKDRLQSLAPVLQWFGEPGPRPMYDRHSRSPAPLVKDGRMFLRAHEYLCAVDVYNGALLWEHDAPGLGIRTNVPRDSGYSAVDERYYYTAEASHCWRLDVETGDLAVPLAMPRALQTGKYDWGYVALLDDVVLGSAVPKGSFYTQAYGPWYDSSVPAQASKVCSRHLFALGRGDGRPRWSYEGAVIGSSIAAGDGLVLFAENRNESVNALDSGLVGIPELWQDLHLVALDVQTGEKQWEVPLDVSPGNSVFYIAYAEQTALVVSSPHVMTYSMYAFDTANGDLRWAGESGYRPDRNTDNHGGHMQHPVIIGGRIYQDPYDYDLKTGQKGSITITRDGHGCGSLSAGADFLYGRGGNPRLYDPAAGGKSSAITHTTRPGCMINIVPAGGVLLIPEASSGCSCNFPVQGSLCFAPAPS